MRSSDSAETYETRDLWLAAALLACGHKLVGLVWHEGRAYFSFDDAVACRKSTDAYWTRDLHVAAKDFADALRTLKDRLHSDGPGPRHGGAF